MTRVQGLLRGERGFALVDTMVAVILISAAVLTLSVVVSTAERGITPALKEAHESREARNLGTRAVIDARVDADRDTNPGFITVEGEDTTVLVPVPAPVTIEFDTLADTTVADSIPLVVSVPAGQQEVRYLVRGDTTFTAEVNKGAGLTPLLDDVVAVESYLYGSVDTSELTSGGPGDLVFLFTGVDIPGTFTVLVYLGPL